MKIKLPLETWTELFGFVPRSQLKQFVPHIGETHGQTIGDRQFVSYIQFFLHKCGEVTFGRLCIFGNMIWNRKNGKLPLADVQIPENVKNFQSITIRNFDESIAAFLQQFQRNSLLTNVNLYFHNCLDFLPQIMTNFVPLFANIHSIEIPSGNLSVLDKLQSEYSQLAIPMLKCARVLTADYNSRDLWYSEWLHIPREDEKPRVLILRGHYLDVDEIRSFAHFIEHIKKDFLEANQAGSFFVKLEIFDSAINVQSLTLENSQTREKLVIKGANGYYNSTTILRYSMGTNEEEFIEEMSQFPNLDADRMIAFA